MKLIKWFTLPVLFFLSSTLLFAQAPGYTRQWKTVDSLLQKRNLPKSALQEVKKIYTRAKAEGQDAQVIKALIYTIQLQQENREDDQLLALAEVEKELSTAKEPAASLLRSLLANLYHTYFQNHRWQLYNRTPTSGSPSNDVATWALADFHKKISSLYLASLRNAGVLQKTSLDAFDPIISKGNMRHLRPTLYDLLAHNALNYFESGERDLAKPAVSFEVTDTVVFAPAAQFATHGFRTADTGSLEYKALTIYQSLVRMHLQDAKPDALIDVDLKRLQFAKTKTSLSDKEPRYAAALTQLINKYGNYPGVAQAHYLLALQHEERASQYHPLKDTTARFERLRARAILEKLVRDSSTKSEGWVNSYNLLQQIIAPSFSFELEKVNIPAEPFRALVKFKNITGLQFQIHRATDDLKAAMSRGGDDRFWASLEKAPSLRSWNQALPQTADLQEHSVEVKIEALPTGDYVLLLRDPGGSGKGRSAQLFHVSTISYVAQGNRFFVLHRKTGQPLAGASVGVYTRTYDYNSNQYTKKKSASFKTDKNGAFQMAVSGREYAERLLEIRHGSEELFLNDLVYHYNYTDEGRIQNDTLARRVFFFTDRSIYRPGQTIYFKAIALTSPKGGNAIAAHYETTIHLRDANDQLIDSLKLATNEYGSLHGTFTLPASTLNGLFSLVEGRNGNRATFSVEEYKRPRFVVAFEKVNTTYKVGDTIHIEGNANSYAGNNVDGAQVRYRVVRQSRFMYPWLMRRGWWPQTERMEITSGTTITTGDGGFTVSFAAIPDQKIAKELDPVFDYRVYADVTDKGGETRSSEMTISAGYKALLLQLTLPARSPVDSFKTFNVRAENLNGQPQRSSIEISISKLKEEERLIRDRYWEEPDLFAMSRDEFVAAFPNDEYSNERDMSTWAKTTVFTKSDSTQLDGTYTLPNLQWQPGFYEVTVTSRDSSGGEVKDKRFVELYSTGGRGLQKPEYLWTKSSTPIEPGNRTSVEVGSSAKDIFLIQEVDKGAAMKDPKTSFSSISAERKRFTFEATEADRGGYGISFFFVKDNRFYQFGDIISVPWSNKTLDIEFATFRDKMLPGSAEKWSVKIKGAKGELVASEMLASMYDASLDGLKTHAWSKPQIWNEYGRTSTWNGMTNFTAVQSNNKWNARQPFKDFNKVYDEFIFRQYGGYELRGRVSGVSVQSTSQNLNEGVVVTTKSKAGYAERDAAADTASPPIEQQQQTAIQEPKDENIPIRKNLVETAFFFPELATDKEGNIEFSFTMPEALTRWKLQTLAHSKELAFGLAQKEVVTQKELMVQPRAPRFLRQGDRIEFSATIVNMSGKEMTGQAEFQLVDAATNQSVDGWFLNSFPNQYFTVAAGGSEVVKFPMEVPYQFSSTLVWRVIARAGAFSDGEEGALPVISNKILITETLPLPMRSTGTKTFNLDKLRESRSPSLLHHALTVEYTSNPAWYAVQAMPYLMENANESAEGIWNRYYANALASHIAGSAPRIRAMFESWKTLDTAALRSNLQKNEELKSALLEETPWVLQGKTESEQKKNIALLFDLLRMNSELQSTLQKLEGMQSSNGGFMWMKGAPDDRYITQYILTGIARLRRLGALPRSGTNALANIESKGLRYLESRLNRDYADLLKSGAKLGGNNLGTTQIQYLYLRSFHNTKPTGAAAKALSYYKSQAKTYWMKQSKLMQGMIALTMHRGEQKATALAIIRSLKETAIQNEELGMYWKDQRYGYSWSWWQAPIETQALMIETFSEVEKGAETVAALKTWLLKNKQTNNWRTTKATADACYALLIQGNDWLTDDRSVEIKLGNVVMNNSSAAERGTGYFKKRIEGPFVKPEMSAVTVTVKSAGPSDRGVTASPSWGAVYWQYFEDLDLVTRAATPLSINKQLFVETVSDRGPIISPVTAAMILKPGDKIKVRIELKVDRDMEYVHMKDLRASALEPVNVISGYKWQGGLGYYETTKDLSTSFYFSHLRRGTYIFEYPLFVTHTGNFSNGITTVQSMYAPEFSAHSQGTRITVE